MDVASFALLLHETAQNHHPYEQSGPKQNWWDWYAAYIDARRSGGAPQEASTAAGLYMEEVLRGAQR